MAKNEKIHIDIESKNMVVIDPNKIDIDGEVVDRYIDQENLQMFANLEVNVVPRAAFIFGDKNESNLLRQTVASGYLNFMGPNNGDKLNTKWTDDFTGGVNDKRIQTDVNGKPIISENKLGYQEGDIDLENQYDTQLLGIKDIDVETKPTNLTTSTVKIRMVDIRGRALMERSDDSIYSVFFNLPYPTFYLTLKGYLGETITYQLVLKGDVKIEFDADGDYYLVAEFLSVNQKLLNDIPLKLVDNISKIGQVENSNQEEGVRPKTRGRLILEKIYQTYYDLGYVDEDIKNLSPSIVEIVEKSKTLNELMDKDLFSTADVSFFDEMAKYQNTLENLLSAVSTWFETYTNYPNPDIVDNDDIVYSLKENLPNGFEAFNKENTQSIYFLIESYLEILRKNPYFGTSNDTKKNITISTKSKQLKIDLRPIPLTLMAEDLVYDEENKLLHISVFEQKIDKTILFFEEQSNLYRDKISDFLLQEQQRTLSFKPTLSNIMGVFLANIEAFLHILEETSNSIKNLSPDKIKMRRSAFSLIDETDDAPDGKSYPWPFIYKNNIKENQKELTYPDDPDIRKLTKGSFTSVWPEMKLIKDYLSAYLVDQTERQDKTESYLKNKKLLLPLDEVYINSNFSETTFIDIVYKIYNRSLYLSSYYFLPNDYKTSLKFNVINTLGIDDGKNAVEAIKYLTDKKELFKTPNLSLINLIKSQNFLPSDLNRIIDVNEFNFTETKQGLSIEKDLIDNGGITILDDVTINNFSKNLGKVNQELLSYYKSNKVNLNIYPFSTNEYKNRLEQKNNIYRVGNNVQFNTENSQIVCTSGYDVIDVDTKIYVGEQQLNILNHHIFSDMENNDNNKNITRAYVILNSLNLRNFNEKIDDDVNYFTNFIHNNIIELNILQALRWGSIWYRYKTYVNTNYDILDTFFENPSYYSDDYINDEFIMDNFSLDFTGLPAWVNGTYTFKFNHTLENIVDVGFYPHLIIQIMNNSLNTNFTLNDIQNLYDQNIINLKLVSSKNVNRSIDSIQVNCWNVSVKYNGKTINVPTYVEPNNNETTLTEVLNNSFNFDGESSVNIDYEKIKDTLRIKLTPNKYFTSRINNRKVLGGEKIDDLLSLFDDTTLNYFENLFINFAQEKHLVSDDTLNLNNIYYQAVTIDDNNSINTLINNRAKVKTITFVKNNPYEIHLSEFNKFVNNSYENVKSEDIDETTFDKDIQLLWGVTKDDSVYYEYAKKFYEDFNLKYNRNNFKKYKGLIKRWLSWYIDNNTLDINTKIETFTVNIKNLVNNTKERADVFVSGMSQTMNKDIVLDTGFDEEEITSKKINNVVVEKALYKQLKDLNDTWVGAWNFDKMTLASFFKYVDQINRPIGDKFYVDISSLTWYYNSVNKDSISIGQFITKFLQKNKLSEPISLGGNVDFYGINKITTDQDITDNDLIEDAQEIANKIFGLHTTVVKNGSPKFIIFQRSHESEILNINRQKYSLKTDGFPLSIADNPIADVDIDLRQKKYGNRSIGFYVDFGIQNQSIFKKFTISSYDGVKTQEQLQVLEDIAKKSTGTESVLINGSILDIIKTRTYSCKIEMIGNVMIQPFMYFDLRYIPIFSGTYLILSVNHRITSDSGIITEFEGVRVSKYSSPELTNTLVRSKRLLLDGLIKSLSKRKQKTSPSDEFEGIIEPVVITPNIVKLPKTNDEGISETSNEHTTSVNTLYDEYNIKTLNQISHFIAQTHKESNGFKSTEENLNYTSISALKNAGFGRLNDLNDSELKQYLNNPEKLAKKVYGNRVDLGNKTEQDGWDFRGRGFIQLTGRDNYTEFSKHISMKYPNKYDVLKNPDLVSNVLAFESACWFWETNKLNQIVNEFADTEEASKRLTKRIRGIQNTYKERHQLFIAYREKYKNNISNT